MSIQAYPAEGERQRGQYAPPNGYQRLENSAPVPAPRFTTIPTSTYPFQLPLNTTQLPSPPHSINHHPQAHEQLQRHVQTNNSEPTRQNTSSSAPQNIRLTTASQINGPITMPGGYFAGKTIRVELIEVQKADVGRKCADPPKPRHSQTTQAPPRSSPPSSSSAPMGFGGNTARVPSGQSSSGSPSLDKSRVGKERIGKKDRRPLDPPPVVEMNVYEVFDLGTEKQREVLVPASKVKLAKFHCCVFLHFLPPDRGVDAGTNIGPTTSSFPGAVPGVSRDSANVADTAQIHRYGDPYSVSSSSTPIPKSGLQLNPNTGYDSYPQQQQSTEQQHSPMQHAQHALFGTTIASAAFVPDLTNHTHTYFVFHDLSVKLEGKFALEYKVFDLLEPVFLPPSPTSPSSSVAGTAYTSTSTSDGAHSPSVRSTISNGSSAIPGSGSSSSSSTTTTTLLRTPPQHQQPPMIQAFSPILATCTGGSFIVYSTKEFPGLKASTPLTRHFSRWGMRVAMRDTERKRRRGGAAGGPKNQNRDHVGEGVEVDEGVRGGGSRNNSHSGSGSGRRERFANGNEAKRRRVRARGGAQGNGAMNLNGHGHGQSQRWTDDDSALYEDDEDDHDDDMYDSDSDNDV